MEYIFSAQDAYTKSLILLCMSSLIVFLILMLIQYDWIENRGVYATWRFQLLFNNMGVYLSAPLGVDLGRGLAYIYIYELIIYLVFLLVKYILLYPLRSPEIAPPSILVHWICPITIFGHEQLLYHIFMLYFMSFISPLTCNRTRK